MLAFLFLLLQGMYDHMEPQTLPLPGEWQEKLNALQRLCMLRCVRADKMPDAILSYVMNSLGKEFVEPPPFDLEACYQDSTVLTPLIFVLSKGSGKLGDEAVTVVGVLQGNSCITLNPCRG